MSSCKTLVKRVRLQQVAAVAGGAGDFEGVLVERAVAFDADFDYAVFPRMGDAHEDVAVFVLALVNGGGFGLAHFAGDKLASAGDAAAIAASDWQRDAVGFANVEDGLVAAHLQLPVIAVGDGYGVR